MNADKTDDAYLCSSVFTGANAFFRFSPKKFLKPFSHR
jgi:hypothetical protein